MTEPLPYSISKRRLKSAVFGKLILFAATVAGLSGCFGSDEDQKASSNPNLSDPVKHVAENHGTIDSSAEELIDDRIAKQDVSRPSTPSAAGPPGDTKQPATPNTSGSSNTTATFKTVSGWTTDPAELLRIYSERTAAHQQLLAEAKQSVVEWKQADGWRMEWLPLAGNLREIDFYDRPKALFWKDEGRVQHGIDRDGKTRVINTDVVLHGSEVVEMIRPNSIDRFMVVDDTTYKSISLALGETIYERQCSIVPGKRAVLTWTMRDMSESENEASVRELHYELNPDNTIHRAFELDQTDSGDQLWLVYVEPNQKPVEELVQDLRSEIVKAVSKHLMSLNPKERAYAIILSYWTESWADSLWLTMAPEGHRNTVLQRSATWEHLWLPDEMLVEFVDGKMVHTDVYNEAWALGVDDRNRLADATQQVHHYCDRVKRRVDVFGLKNPFVVAALGAAQELNQVDWSKHFAVTDDFAIVVVHQTSDRLTEELRRSMPPDRFELLQSRGRIRQQ